MKGLLVKDFHLLMQRKSFFFLLAVLTVFMSFTMEGTLFAVGWVTMLMGIVSFSTIAYDEYDNCLPFLMSLPATRRDYAAGKYLFSIISGFAGWIFAAVVKLIISLMQSEFGTSIKELSTALVFLPLLLILLSCCIPVELKWGAEKGRMYLLVISAGSSRFFGENGRRPQLPDSCLPHLYPLLPYICRLSLLKHPHHAEERILSKK